MKFYFDKVWVQIRVIKAQLPSTADSIKNKSLNTVLSSSIFFSICSGNLKKNEKISKLVSAKIPVFFSVAVESLYQKKTLYLYMLAWLLSL